MGKRWVGEEYHTSICPWSVIFSADLESRRTLISRTKKTRLTKMDTIIGAVNKAKNGMLLGRMKHMVSARYPCSVTVTLPTVCFWVKRK